MKQITDIEQKYLITSETDVDGNIVYASPAFNTISGYSNEELIGKSHAIVRHPDTPNKVFEQMWRTIQSGKVWSGEIMNMHRDGSAYWVDSSIHPLFDDNGNIRGYKSVRFDITDRKYFQAQLKENRKTAQESRMILDLVMSGIAFLDNDGRFVDVNLYVLQTYGYTHQELIGTHICSFLASHDEGERFSSFKDVQENDSAKNTLKQIKHKNGSILWTEIVYERFDENRILLAIKNVEPYKALEEKSKLLLSTSKQAAMGEMLSMIAHQWRQPLTSLMALLSKMKLKQEMGVMSKEDFLNDFTKGKNIVAHLSKTVDLFRDYFKEKQGAPTDISSLLKNVNEILLALMDSNNIATKFECKDGPLQIDDRLDQVILNIYQNASDALMQKNIEMKYIHTKAYPQGNMAVVEIQDNAGGIPEEIIQKIFTPYFSTKSKNGSGLGLYMSKDIVENTLKGKLSVKNTKDGACFTIKVPIIKLTKQGEK